MFLRRAVPEDALAVAHVHVSAWQAAYRTLIPDEYLDRLSAEERAQKYDFANPDPAYPQTIVADEGGLIVGFATTSKSRDEDLAGYGELCALYVDPKYWSRGYGVALALHARKQLLDRGYNNALLWVLKGNVRAERFYRNDGWSSDGHERTDTVWGAVVEELRYIRALAQA
jgi:GNAT superfamily N-acetyltransferase